MSNLGCYPSFIVLICIWLSSVNSLTQNISAESHLMSQCVATFPPDVFRRHVQFYSQSSSCEGKHPQNHLFPMKYPRYVSVCVLDQRSAQPVPGPAGPALGPPPGESTGWAFCSG